MKTFSLTLALVCLSPLALAGNLRSEIESTNTKVCNAIKHKNIAEFTRICKGAVTSDFKHIENGKSLNFDQMVAEMKQGFAQMGNVTEVKTTILSLKEKGNNATGTTKHSMTSTMKGQDKKTHKMTYTGVTTDVYRKVNGKWKLASMTWGSQKMLLDGKPMDMSKMGGGK